LEALLTNALCPVESRVHDLTGDSGASAPAASGASAISFLPIALLGSFDLTR
jgi:hypothetical protein